MPCGDNGQAAYEAGRALQQADKEIDELTRMLCAMCTAYESEIVIGHRNNLPIMASGLVIPEPVASWWEKHKTLDEIRQRGERNKAERDEQIQQARHTGLNKLTDEEKIALGLHNE